MPHVQLGLVRTVSGQEPTISGREEPREFRKSFIVLLSFITECVKALKEECSRRSACAHTARCRLFSSYQITLSLCVYMPARVRTKHVIRLLATSSYARSCHQSACFSSYLGAAVSSPVNFFMPVGTCWKSSRSGWKSRARCWT
jgi:hypothetical protein